ncbi:hypothetical protein GOP47_0012868 [Adiantum capillus-veneris]|uniref:Uncharacterized protein n=1 Tax=Adiantum capillus-veneris TaxID=13818 RepID=A0A9D4USL5_ADICA|nr:hypothetical protein GOP47_0012868 [Adiantum capillus-veneris]
MADEEWEWVHSPPDFFPGTPRSEDDDRYTMFFGRGTATPALSNLHLNTAQVPENSSSTASSPILRHNLSARVMAKECFSALDALHHSVLEWIEPQLVFTKPHDYQLEGFDIFKVIMRLRNMSKESLVSLLSDPNVCDAIMSNKAFQEMVIEHSDDVDDRLEGRNLMSASDFSFGRKVYMLLKEKLVEAIDAVVSLLGTHIIERSVVDNLDETTKSCILLVAVLVFFVIGKRSEKAFCLPHALYNDSMMEAVSAGGSSLAFKSISISNYMKGS